MLIRLNAVVRRDGTEAQFRVNFRYTSRDPYAVSLTFVNPTGKQPPVEWEVDRELIDIGLDLPTGLGDIRFVPLTDTVDMHMTSPSGTAVATFQREDLVNALEATYIVVPLGTESRHLDWTDGEKLGVKI